MLAATSLAASLVLGAAHPHLFFQSGDVPALRSAAETTHGEIASHLTQILSQHLSDPAPTQSDYDDPRFFGQDVCAWAFGYQLTGDARYAAQATLRLQTYLGWSDWGFGEIASLGEPDLNVGHFLIGVSCAYDLLYGALSDADRSAIATRLGAEADRMYQGWPNAWYADQYPQNHNWINAAGMGLAGLALQGEDSRASAWLARAQDDLAKVNLVLAQIPDGSWHEGILYQEYGISMSLPFWMALRAGGADYTDMGILRGLGTMFLTAQIPDVPRQQILLHGDFTGWPEGGMISMLRFTAARFQDGFAETAARRWLAAGLRSHLLPDMFFEVFEFLGFDPAIAPSDPHTLPLDSYLPDLQAAVLHSSWDKGDLALAFKAAPYGGRANFDRMKTGGAPGGHLNWGHDHNDDMSFWMWGKGTWLAPEAAGYDAGTNTGYPVSGRANMTTFHNGLLIDGNGQMGDTRASDDETANSWFFSRDARPLLLPTGTADYAVAGGRGASLYGPSLGLSRWDRLVVLARNRYALVHDDVAASSSHTYDWICHFLDGANVDTASGWVQGVGRNGMSLGVRVVSPASWTATTGTQSENLTLLFEPLDGSISYVRIRPSAASAATQFLTALVPVQTAAWSSRVRIDPLSASDAGAGTVIAPGTSLEERWIFGSDGVDAKTAGDLSLSRALAGMAARNAGVPVRALLIGPGNVSDQSGSRLLLASESARSIEADVQGTTLAVTGDGIADFQAFAPSATALTINGRPASASKSAGVVRYPPIPLTVAIVSSPSALTNRTAASFELASNADEATFSCTVDSGASAACSTPASYQALADGSHTFAVTARDAMGSTSARASFTWVVDATPPTVSIAAGPASLTRETSAIFGFSSSEAGSSFTCKLDALDPVPCTSPATYDALLDGAHVFTAIATDSAGNASAPASSSWTVDTAPPGASIVSGPPPVTNQTAATFTFASNKPGSAYLCKLDTAAGDACSNPLRLSGLADGSHSLSVRATDELGNVDPVPAAWSWTIDTVAPTTTITSHPPAVTTMTSAELTFSASKPSATFECKVDGAGDFAPCATPLSLTGLALGDHAVVVRSRDALGNFDPAPPSVRWTIAGPTEQVGRVGCSTARSPAASILICIAAGLAHAMRRRRVRTRPIRRASIRPAARSRTGTSGTATSSITRTTR